MIRLAIIGSGDLGAQIAYHAKATGKFSLVGFFDDFRKKGTEYNGLPILGSSGDVLSVFKADAFDVLMIGIGYKHMEMRAALFRRFKGTIPFGSVIHESSYVDKSCKLGEGLFIYPGCKLDMNVVIRDNVLLNVGCVIAHDTVVGDHCFFGPSVSVAGFVTIDESVNLGIGTVVVDNVRIVKGVRTGAGAVVVVNLEQEGLYIGVPAKIKSI